MSCLILLHSSEPRGLPKGQTPDVVNNMLVLVSLVRTNYSLCIRNSGVRNEAIILLPNSSPTPELHSQRKDFHVLVPNLYITPSEFCGTFLSVLYWESPTGPSIICIDVKNTEVYHVLCSNIPLLKAVAKYASPLQTVANGCWVREGEVLYKRRFFSFPQNSK